MWIVKSYSRHRLSFPKDLGFRIIRHHISDIAISTHLIVVSPNNAITFILSLTTPGRGPYSGSTPVPLIDSGQVYHIVALGLDFATSQAVVPEADFGYSYCRNIPEYTAFTAHYQMRENWNTSILEPSGYCRFIEHMTNARSAVGHPWTEMLTDLNGRAVKNVWLPPKRLPPLPSPQIRDKDINTRSTMSQSYLRELPVRHLFGKPQS